MRREPTHRHFFRRHSAQEDPELLLEPENQVSTPWGADERGECDKCERRGRVLHECLSCLAAEPDLSGDVIVEIEAELTGDIDLDAERGAVLVRPLRIVEVHAVDPARLSRRHVEEAAGPKRG